MCRILAVVSRRPIPADILMAFRQLSATGKTYKDFGCPQANPKPAHPDGWGIACVGAEGEVYARSPRKAAEDSAYEDALRRIGATVIPPVVLLAHVRRASVRDSIREQFCHPFRRELDGRVVYFAHNGSIEGYGIRNGRIDSQEIFERFLVALGDSGRPLTELKQTLAKAKEGLEQEWPRKISSLTFVLVDGNHVIAHRDARTCVPYYTLHVTEVDGMQVICSEVLPNLPGRWRMLRNGEFLEVAAPG